MLPWCSAVTKLTKKLDPRTSLWGEIEAEECEMLIFAHLPLSYGKRNMEKRMHNKSHAQLLQLHEGYNFNHT